MANPCDNAGGAVPYYGKARNGMNASPIGAKNQARYHLASRMYMGFVRAAILPSDFRSSTRT